MSINLKKEFEKGQEGLIKITKEFPWEDPMAYAYWLGQTYFYAHKSNRILALAAAHFPPEENKFHHRFIDHAREEKGHEKLLLTDLKILQWKIEDIPDLPEMTAFYQGLFFWIEHIHPVGLFGWVLCLEGLAVKEGPQLYDRVRRAHGEKASTFLKVHSHEDVGHLSTAFALLEGLSEEQKKMICQNFHQCCALYGWVFKKIMMVTSESEMKRAG
jgi:thiaminase